MRQNLCPVCGPVHPEVSSRYCIEHLRELLARCLEMPAAREWHEVPLDATMRDWLKPAVARRRAA
ncbi:MAG TPA: hypothetical protein VG370_25290 [Chloroflexota bacterium]|jgi:hypothetical protein|nr:hypothetical protein [Chloroflexota bacterium]